MIERASDKPEKANEPCLHCYLRAALNSYTEDLGEIDSESGMPMLDVHDCLDHLADLAAELIASHPEPAKRKAMRRDFAAYMARRVRKRVASGEHLPTKISRLQ